jgi:RHS repeat-associated protein
MYGVISLFVVQSNAYCLYGGLAYVSDNTVEMNRMQHRKFEGKELDRLHVLYLYDAAICQFTSVDPMCEDYYHISPYAYCAGNPVKYTDPTGMLIQVDGSDSDKSWVLTILQKLTNDKLVMDKKGYISIGSKGSVNPDQDLSCGTSLLREVIGSKHTAFVRIGGKNNEDPLLKDKRYDRSMGRNYYADKVNCYNGIGVDATIILKPGNASGLLVTEKSNGKGKTILEEVRPEYVGAAHEFIHGLRDMKGEAVSMESVRYDYIDDLNSWQQQQEGLEEFHTIGIMGNYRYTENKIRKEHGLGWRICY